MNITIKNININAISTLGSMNVGKAIFTQNRSSSIQLPKSHFEETEADEEEIRETVEGMVPQSTYPRND